MARLIAHVDLDAFFCEVEALRQPTLRGKAYAVAGRPDQRGVVASASYPARAHGVRSAMPTAQALRLCPGLIVVPPSHGVYGTHSRQVMEVLRGYSSDFEQISVDEAFLDLSGFPEDPHALGLEIQRRIAESCQLPASLGLASCKLVAKMASGEAKPNGVLVVPAGGEAAFLAPMPVGALWGVGAATSARLKALGIETVGALANTDPAMLRGVFGNQASQAVARARGVDPSEVRGGRELKSVSEERTFTKDLADHHALHAVLVALSDEVARRLRDNHVYARTIHLKLRWSDFETITRQVTLSAPTHFGEDIRAAVDALFRVAWAPGRRVRLLGVGASGLSEGVQADLFSGQVNPSREALARTLDALQERYGRDAVGRATLRKRKPPAP